MVRKTKFTFNGKVFDEENYPENMSPPYYHGTTSCAIGFASFQNYHTVKEIKRFVEHVRKDSNSKVFSPAERNHGEKSLIVIVVSPNENELEKKLITCGFSLIADNLSRRNGYPKNNVLKMYLIKL